MKNKIRAHWWMVHVSSRQLVISIFRKREEKKRNRSRKEKLAINGKHLAASNRSVSYLITCIQTIINRSSSTRFYYRRCVFDELIYDTVEMPCRRTSLSCVCILKIKFVTWFSWDRWFYHRYWVLSGTFGSSQTHHK